MPKFNKLFSISLILFIFVFFIAKPSFSSDLLHELDSSRYFTGQIDNKYGIKMVLKLSKNGLIGKYFYDSVGEPLDIQGKTIEENNEEKIELKEFDKKGNQTGLFRGYLTNGEDGIDGIVGVWSKPDGSNKMPFKLKYLDILVTQAEIKDKKTKEQLVGNHNTSLQWISWDYFGTAKIVNVDGFLFLYGGQKQKDGTDFFTIEGIITMVDKTKFKFFGEIITQVSYIAKGQPCRQFTEKTFAITQGRNFWRMQEMLNQCDEVTDYIDISIKK